MAENRRRRFNITPPPSSTPVAARPPRVEVQESDQVRRSQLTLEDVPGLERPLTSGTGDRPVGIDEATGLPVYETVTGQRYTVGLNPDQRTGRQRFEEDTLPAIQEYIENPTLPSAEQVVDFAVGVGQSVYQQIDDAVSGQGTLGSALELMPQIAAISATQRVPEGAIRIFGGFNKAVDPAVDEAGRRLPITIGADGLRRFEIDDSVASFIPDNVRAMDVDSQWNNLDLEATDQLPVNRRPYSFVDEVIEHPELFRQYPELRDIRVVVDTALESPYNGYFSPTRNLIAVSKDVASDPRQFAAVLLHEIQHGVQRQEGFDSGTNPALDADEVTNRALPDLTVIQNRRNTAVDLIQEYDFDSSVGNITSFLDDMIAEREARLGIPDYADRTIREDLERKLEVLRENPLNTQARSDLALAMRNFFDSFRENQGRVPRELRERFRNDFGISLGELEGTPKNRVDYLLELNTVIPIRPERYDDALSDIRFDTYEGRSGEIEARNVSNRMDLSIEDRFDLPPGQFFDREARRLASRGNLTNPGPWRVDAEGNILEAQTPRQVGGLSAAIGNFIARRRGSTPVDTPDQSSTSMSSSPEVSEDTLDLPPPEAAQRTQIAGTLPTYRKANDLLTEEFGEGPTLDFGAGLGLSQRELGFDTFEPFPREGFEPTYSSAADIPDASYDRITNLNVLNVVPREARDEIVRDIGRILRPGGVGVITTRGRDVMAATGRAGPEDMSIITSAGTYQKGFRQAELREYIQEILGDGFEVTNNRLGAAGVTIRKLSEERGFNKGGLAMDDQMKNLLEEGGLTDDGMKKDPVSGNDVPSGSMAEEVRDDIDARLSEGEYVVPADVVRYYGVKFFEDLRGQAKEDLNDMEESGRIGGEPVEMAAGGMVQASNFNPNIPSAQTPAQMPQQGYALGGMVGQVLNSVPNFANQPTTTQDQNMYLQTPYASLADLFADFRQVGSYTQRGRTGTPAPTAPTAPTPTEPSGTIEYRTYVGPNGEIMMIPFLNGEPQITIPAGFRPQGDVSQTPQVQTGGDGDSGVQAPQGPQTTEQRLAEIDAALEDVNYEDPLGAGAAALEGGKGIGSIAGTVIGLLAAGPLGARLGNALGGAVDQAGSLADAAVNAEVAGILGYDTTELDASITSKLNEMGTLSRAFAENAITTARQKAREAITNVDSPYPLTRDKFQSDEAFETAMAEVAPAGMTYQPDTGGYLRTETNEERDARWAEEGVIRTGTGPQGTPIYTVTADSTAPRPAPRPSNLAGATAPAPSSGGGDSGGGGGDTSNIGNWGGDRDGDGVPNAFDFDDGVGWADTNKGGGTTTASSKGPSSSSSSSDSGGGGGGGGDSCFLAGTPVTMADGTYKAIEDIKLNDVIKGGGKVFALGQFINDEIYKYKDIYVSGSHLVKENGKWLRVRDSKISVPYSDEEHTVYVLGTEDHIIEIKDVTFSDYFEAHAQDLLIKYQDSFFDFYKSREYIKDSEKLREEVVNSETSQ